MKKWLEVDCQE